MDARTWEFHRETGLKCFAFSSQAKGFYTKLEQLGEAGLSPKARERFYFPENTDRLAELKSSPARRDIRSTRCAYCI